VIKSAAWNVVGVDFHAKQLAEEAARQSGQPIGDWLNAIIGEKASELGVTPGEADEEGRLERITARLGKRRKTAALRRPALGAPVVVEPDSNSDEDQRAAPEPPRRRTDAAEASYSEMRRPLPRPAAGRWPRIEEPSAEAREPDAKLTAIARRLTAIENALTLVLECLEQGGQLGATSQDVPWDAPSAVARPRR
jgi:hypothetical protein